MSAPFRLTLWTADAALAARADAAGVDRIGVDLDRFGKAERQAGLDSWISPHTEADLVRVGAGLRRAQCFVRIDPLNPDTPRQIERVLACGAQVVMLPMAHRADEIACVVDLLAGRAELVPLLECAAGLRAIAELGALGVAEAHVGLNDLALSLGVTDRFAALLSDELATAVAQAQRAGLPLGIGGIGRAGDNTLPIPAAWSTPSRRACTAPARCCRVRSSSATRSTSRPRLPRRAPRSSAGAARRPANSRPPTTSSTVG